MTSAAILTSSKTAIASGQRQRGNQTRLHRRPRMSVNPAKRLNEDRLELAPLRPQRRLSKRAALNRSRRLLWTSTRSAKPDAGIADLRVSKRANSYYFSTNINSLGHILPAIPALPAREPNTGGKSRTGEAPEMARRQLPAPFVSRYCETVRYPFAPQLIENTIDNDI